MSEIKVRCDECQKIFTRSLRQVNEGKKFRWNSYCSSKCQSKAKNFQIRLVCSRTGCRKVFKRKRAAYLKSGIAYCSRTCAAIVNNHKFPKKPGIVKKCAYCGANFVSGKKYCSRGCKDKGQVIGREELLMKIRDFVKEEKRIPLKREFRNYHAIRARFGTWNNAIKEVGFTPNPVMFAKKYISKDGHRCDSFAERIIDDWFYARNTKHERDIPYPGGQKLKVDFRVGKYWIEFFGLAGQHKRYDQLKRKKIRLAKKLKLDLVRIYPRDLFPKGKLNEKFSFLLK
jgi:hypothetical protein